MRITVLMGGTSSERDVSLASGLRIAEALRTRGHFVRSVDTAKGALSEGDERRMIAAGVVKHAPPTPEELARMKAESVADTAARLPKRGETDVAFLALHGGSGEDGTIQALLDLAGVPYTGSGHLASALAMDKDLSKHMMRAYDVPTADWLMANDPQSLPDVEHVVSTLGLPLIVKPSKQGSTVGLSIVKEPSELVPAIREAFKHDDEVMLEQFIAGRELTVTILGNVALPVGEIVAKKEIYDYECKYMDDASGARGLGERPFDVGADSRLGRRIAYQLERADHRLERVIELMRHARHELSDGRQAFASHELLAETKVVREIADDADQVRHASARVDDWRSRD